VLDASDAFPLDPSESVDTDHDGVGNNADSDDDGDGDPDATDCAPLNPQVGHNAAEIANGIDDNCNGQIDESQGQLTFGGLLSPYAPPPSTFKLGRTIPLQWQYRNAQGAVVDSAAANPTVNVYGPVSCGVTTGGTTIDVSAPGASGYRYDAGTKTWAFNWQTRGLAPGCYYLNVASSIAQPSGWLSIQLK
jgi:hypothetical protein